MKATVFEIAGGFGRPPHLGNKRLGKGKVNVRRLSSHIFKETIRW